MGVFTIHLPPLRERGDDLPQLVQHYVRRFSRELGREIASVAPEALSRLSAYSWPGNIRELQSILKQALLQASGSVLLPSFIPDLASASGSTASSAPAPVASELDLERFIADRLTPEARDIYAAVHGELDRLLLTRVLEYTRGNQLQAARMLGIARQTLRLKLRELGLQITQSVEADEE